MALRVSSAYRTVSNEAAMMVAGMPPIHLLAIERTQIERAKNQGIAVDRAKEDARNHLIAKWQEEWDVAVNRRWAHRLIPNIQQWIHRNHGQVNFHLTQFLTGHGCINACL